MRELWRFLRANPQALVLLVICIVLGLGTFLAAVLGLLSSGPGRTSGEPSGAIWADPVSSRAFRPGSFHGHTHACRHVSRPHASDTA
jgi:hypothetical protein